MIEGNYNNKTAYVHTAILWGKLFAAGWPVTKRDLTAADDVAVEVIKSTEELGYWYYWCWAPTASGNKVLIKLMEYDLVPTAIEASIDQLQAEQKAAIYKYAKCYRYKKPTVWQRVKNLLANRTSLAGAKSLRLRPENNTQGAAQTLRPLPISNRGAL